jgi:hypothetical protein
VTLRVRVTFPGRAPSQDTKKRLRDLARRLAAVVEYRGKKPLPIMFAPTVAVAIVRDGVRHGSGLGLFMVDDDGPRIAVGRCVEYVSGHRALVETLAHELVHFEDWRDNREPPLLKRSKVIQGHHKDHWRRTRALMRRAGFRY